MEKNKKTVRPRRVKACATTDYGHGYIDDKDGIYRIPETPLWTIPRSADAYDDIVGQLAVALFKADDEPHWGKDAPSDYYERLARAALKSIGITRPIENKDMTK